VVIDAIVKNQFLSVLSRDNLVRLKLKALKSGAWFRVLKNVERALVDLTIRVVDRARSPVLVKALLSIMGKLMDAQKTKVEVAVNEVGLPNARRFSLLAQKWGNKSARKWMFDLSFARFIAVMYLNSPASFPP
jgi:hypothetical protein